MKRKRHHRGTGREGENFCGKGVTFASVFINSLLPFDARFSFLHNTACSCENHTLE